MNFASLSASPPDGPSCAPTTVTSSHAMAPGATKAGSDDALPGRTWPHTALVSRECCHVARMVPFSIGFGLKKCVVSCLPDWLNSVASGRARCGVTEFDVSAVFQAGAG